MMMMMVVVMMRMMMMMMTMTLLYMTVPNHTVSSYDPDLSLGSCTKSRRSRPMPLAAFFQNKMCDAVSATGQGEHTQDRYDGSPRRVSTIFIMFRMKDKIVLEQDVRRRLCDRPRGPTTPNVVTHVPSSYESSLRMFFLIRTVVDGWFLLIRIAVAGVALIRPSQTTVSPLRCACLGTLTNARERQKRLAELALGVGIQRVLKAHHTSHTFSKHPFATLADPPPYK
jgi:hypothetical protein